MVADAVINSHKGKAFWLSTDVTGISESHAHRVKKKIVLVVDVIRTLTIFVMAFATIFERPIWCYDDESYGIARQYNRVYWNNDEEYFISNNFLMVLDVCCLASIMITMGMRVYMSFAEVNDYAILAVWITWTTSRIMEFSTKSKSDHAMEQDAALTSALCRMILVMLVSRPIRCGLYVHSLHPRTFTNSHTNTHRKMTLAVIPVTLDVFVLYTVFLIFTSGSVTVLLNPNVVENREYAEQLSYGYSTFSSSLRETHFFILKATFPASMSQALEIHPMLSIMFVYCT